MSIEVRRDKGAALINDSCFLAGHFLFVKSQPRTTYFNGPSDAMAIGIKACNALL